VRLGSTGYFSLFLIEIPVRRLYRQWLGWQERQVGVRLLNGRVVADLGNSVDVLHLFPGYAVFMVDKHVAVK
jgi:hypothetical protein